MPLFLEQLSQTGSLDNNLILRRYELDPTARFTEKKSVNPKLGEDQLGNSTFHRYKNDRNMLSIYRIPPDSHKEKKFWNGEHDLEIPQMTSDHLKRPQSTSKGSSPNTESVKLKKNKLKGGGNIEIDDNYSDEKLHNNNL